MGWEFRGSRRYYYRKIWNGGQVCSEYVGSGAIGKLAARRDEQRRTERCRRREAVRDRIRRGQAIDAELEDAADKLRAAATILLENAGFRKHKGTWRKKRSVERNRTNGR